MRFLGVVAVVAVVVLLALMNLPAQLSYLRGTWPDHESYEHACPADEPGTKNCSTVTSFRWRLVGGARADTTLRVSRDDVSSITGVMNLANSACRDARVAWELTFAGRVTEGELTADDRSAAVNATVPEPLPEARLRLWRTDAAGCACEFRWDEPWLDVPAFNLPF